MQHTRSYGWRLIPCQEEMIYCLKIDCKKFYPSIDHETLKQKFRRKYKDPELLELIDEVIDSNQHLSGNG